MQSIVEREEALELSWNPSPTLPPAMIKVSIVEDDARLRETMARYFAGQSGFKCLCTYPDAESALAGIPQDPPDVVLMDIPKDRFER